MISTGAIGTAFAGLATGGTNVTNIAETMGVTPEMQVAAWAGFTAIVSQFKAVFDALAVKVLTPEMVAAILSVIDALANELGKPEVAKAIQEIIFAVLDLALAFIPLIPLIADVVSWLGETGLLKYLLLIIVAAEILLPTLAYVQFVFYAIEGVVGALSAAAGILGIGLGFLVVAIAAVLILVDFLIHLYDNMSNGMFFLTAIFVAFIQTLTDVATIIISIINSISKIIGIGEVLKNPSSDNERTTSKTTINNITFAKNVNTGDKAQVAKTASQISNSTMG